MPHVIHENNLLHDPYRTLLLMNVRPSVGGEHKESRVQPIILAYILRKSKVRERCERPYGCIWLYSNGVERRIVNHGLNNKACSPFLSHNIVNTSNTKMVALHRQPKVVSSPTTILTKRKLYMSLKYQTR